MYLFRLGEVGVPWVERQEAPARQGRLSTGMHEELQDTPFGWNIDHVKGSNGHKEDNDHSQIMNGLKHNGKKSSSQEKWKIKMTENKDPKCYKLRNTFISLYLKEHEKKKERGISEHSD